MADIFTYTPSRAFSKSSRINTNNISFGDGYSQRVITGINSQSDSWEMSFINIPVDTANNIVAFLQSKRGVTYFLFTPPGESTEYKVIANNWTVEYGSEISRTIKTTFERVFDLT